MEEYPKNIKKLLTNPFLGDWELHPLDLWVDEDQNNPLGVRSQLI